MFKIELGSEVKDLVTGFKGIVCQRVEYLTGCNRYGVQQKLSKDGKVADMHYFDENVLEVIGKGVSIKQTPIQKIKGGSQPSENSRSRLI